MKIDELTLVMFLHGDYAKMPIFKTNVLRNITIANGAKVIIVDDEMFSKLSKGNPQFCMMSKKVDSLNNNDYTAYLGDSIRLEFVYGIEHCLYIDADSTLTHELIDYILENPKQSFVSAWKESENKVWGCPGGFTYHGEGRNEVFETVINFYRYKITPQTMLLNDIQNLSYLCELDAETMMALPDLKLIELKKDYVHFSASHVHKLCGKFPKIYYVSGDMEWRNMMERLEKLEIPDKNCPLVIFNLAWYVPSEILQKTYGMEHVAVLHNNYYISPDEMLISMKSVDRYEDTVYERLYLPD